MEIVRGALKYVTYYLATNCGQISAASASFAIDFLVRLSGFQDPTE